MAKSAVLDEILSDYCTKSDEHKFQEGILRAFCDFAAGWLAQKGIIGVGHTAEGLALRFGDGTERVLLSTEFVPQTNTPSYQVTGVGGRGDGLPNPNSTFAITGR